MRGKTLLNEPTAEDARVTESCGNVFADLGFSAARG